MLAWILTYQSWCQVVINGLDQCLRRATPGPGFSDSYKAVIRFQKNQDNIFLRPTLLGIPETIIEVKDKVFGHHPLDFQNKLFTWVRCIEDPNPLPSWMHQNF